MQIVVATLVLAIAAASACPVYHRERIQLQSQANAIAPFLWVTWPADRTTGDRALVENQMGKGDDAFVYRHTRTLDRKTSAIVTAACPNGNARIVGVRILTGSHRGDFGFVDAQDVRF